MRLFKKILLIITIFILSACSSPAPPTEPAPARTPQPAKAVFLPTKTPLPVHEVISASIPLPPDGYLYHGVFPGGRSGEEDDITPGDLASYEQTVGKDAAWVYFSNNWFKSRDFPTEIAEWIREAGSVPYIRLMLRHDLKYDEEDTTYSLQNIIDGRFDEDLHAWCEKAREFGTHILVEYGTEVNSDSFTWSGANNGGEITTGYGDSTIPDGPERFKDAYRRIIQICRDEGAGNITWVFHMDSASHPDRSWNRAENYYPGDEWVHWIGVSIYGVHRPDGTFFEIFSPRMDATYSDILEFAPHKPVIITEFGTAKNNPWLDQIQWARDALTSLDTARYPNLIGFSWWNERWQNDRHAENDTTMRVQDNPELAELFQELIGNNSNVLGEIRQ